MRIGAPLLASLATLLLSVPAVAQNNAALVAKAREIHRRVITMDTHDDIPRNFGTAEANPCQSMDRRQVDIPKMRQGGLECRVLRRVCRSGPAHAGGQRQRQSAGDGQVPRHPRHGGEAVPAADPDRVSPCGREAHHRQRPAGHGHRSGKRLHHRRRRLTPQNLLRPRGSLSHPRAHVQQRHRGLVDGSLRSRMERPLPVRRERRCRDEPAGHDGGRLAHLEGRGAARHARLEGARDRVALVHARAGRRAPQHG